MPAADEKAAHTWRHAVSQWQLREAGCQVSREASWRALQALRHVGARLSKDEAIAEAHDNGLPFQQPWRLQLLASNACLLKALLRQQRLPAPPASISPSARRKSPDIC